MSSTTHVLPTNVAKSTVAVAAVCSGSCSADGIEVPAAQACSANSPQSSAAEIIERALHLIQGPR
jgi:hypothetical protein